MKKTYEVRLYDEPLITFSLEEKGLEGLQAAVLSINSEKNIFSHLIWS